MFSHKKNTILWLLASIGGKVRYVIEVSEGVSGGKIEFWSWPNFELIVSQGYLLFVSEYLSSLTFSLQSTAEFSPFVISGL